MIEKESKKKFDSVKMMRDIRDRLSEIYIKDPRIEEAELEKIKKKYGIKSKEKISV